MRVLVTGAGGDVGRVVAADLAARAHVRTLTRCGHPGIGHEQRRGDVRDAEAVREAADGMDAIVHLAALKPVHIDDPDPLLSFEVNVRGTWHVLEAARRARVPRVVLASSIAATGCLSPTFSPAVLPIRETDPAMPASPYAGGKLAAEVLAGTYARNYGLRTVALRIAGVQRPEVPTARPDDDFNLPVLWTWVSPEDVSRAVDAALRADVDAPVVCNVTSEDTCSFSPSAELAERYFPSARIEVDAIPVAGRRWPLFSGRAAREVLGWQPRDRFDERYRAGQLARGEVDLASGEARA